MELMEFVTPAALLACGVVEADIRFNSRFCVGDGSKLFRLPPERLRARFFGVENAPRPSLGVPEAECVRNFLGLSILRR